MCPALRERLTRPEPGTAHVPESWIPKGDIFLYSSTHDLETTLWTFSVRDRKAARFGDVTSRGAPTNAVFSPDGLRIAYQAPMWSRDGKELFFVPAPSQFAAVTVRTTEPFTFTTPESVPRRFGLAPPANPRPYDILPDGRFVAVDAATQLGEARSEQIHVVVNWFEELKGRRPVAR
jgi:hypothetical protein